MTTREAAAHAEVSESVVRAWVRSRSLPHYRLGMPGKRGKVVIRPADLEAFLAGRRVEPAAAPAPPPPAPVKPKFRHLRLPPA